MFQFPGFALKTLCIQVKSTWLTALLITPERNNNTISGGLPHSEIHGSKHILSSPWLIAEYHVLHRLLLPRHPPNALLALDLIQKEKDSFRSKAYFPAPMNRADHRDIWLVYLTWTTLFVSACRHVGGRGNSPFTCSPRPKAWHKTEMFPLRGNIKQC